jgi:predicted DNA-binding protein (MmcQ/YjbR family)
LEKQKTTIKIKKEKRKPLKQLEAGRWVGLHMLEAHWVGVY